jgi:type IV pilus assembly protein PilA
VSKGKSLREDEAQSHGAPADQEHAGLPLQADIGTEDLANTPQAQRSPSGGFTFMLHKLRQRAQSEKGFTLIELLVVILIIGILAAIALPAFLNQRSKAQDANAKSVVRTAQTAMETYYTDNQTYVGADLPALKLIEPSLADAIVAAPAGNSLTINAPGTTGYGLTATSKSSDAGTFTITNAGGAVTRSCSKPNTGGCNKNSSW